MSLHETPSPLYPASHVQVKLPAVFVQVAFASQLSVSREHSSLSLHVVPFPMNPIRHAQEYDPIEFEQF
eukprot:3903142-Rhodomonas_salina.1